VAVESIPISIHPEIDLFTADPPKIARFALAFRPFHIRADSYAAALRGKGV
jgi:hypothetical protein